MSNSYLVKTEELLQIHASSQNGISMEESTLRRKKFGDNRIKTKNKENPFIIFLRQFKSPLVYILVIAGVLSILLGEEVDALVIFISIMLNVLVGFVQEYRASSALAALFEHTVLETTVIRSGHKHLIDAAHIVPGDVIELKSGDKVPADARLLESRNLESDESLLTGESFPRKKKSIEIQEERPLAERDNMVYMGTNIVSGNCRALVVATGENTELGEISRSIHETKEHKTRIQQELESLARFLGIAFLVIIMIVFAIGMLRGNDFIDMFTESIALAVSALPEGLPVSVTVIFAIGMQKILKKNGLIRKLLATETLGRTEVLCVDKTGTLTKGKMEVVEIGFLDTRQSLKNVQIQNDTAKEAVTASALCNTAFLEKTSEGKKFRGKPTDVALLKLGDRFGIEKESFEDSGKILDVYPFNQNLKLSAALLKESKNNKLYVCGAPEVLIKRSKSVMTTTASNPSHFSKAEKKKLLTLNEKLGRKGYRILSVGFKYESGEQREIKPNFSELTFLGLIVISDPLRKTAKETVDQAQKAGLQLALVTGDHITTARTVAQKIGLPCKEENIINGTELEKLTDPELYEKIEDICVYARVSPSDKVRIVQAWQKKGKIVAMTGDGINDAPALHLANIGIALGSGTDVAKESADIVLLNDNLKTILDAIAEGRRILDNIKKVVLYLLSDGLAEVTLVGFAVVLGWPLPILAAQILWVNLVEDGLPAIALANEPGEKDALTVPPRVYKMKIMDKELRVFTLIFGWIDDIALISLFAILYLTGQDIDFIRTMLFAALTIDSLFFAYACKSLRKPLWKIPVLSNKLLNISFIIGIVLLIAAVYFPVLQRLLRTVPLDFPHWMILFVIGILDLLTLELVKTIFIKRGFWKAGYKE